MKSAKKKDASRGGRSPAPSDASPGFPRWAFVVLIVAGLAAFTLWATRSRHIDRTRPVISSGPFAITNAPGVAAQPKSDFQRLAGRWVRPDGGYIIELKSVEDSGKMSAAYFNPRPIHVARAEASQAGTVTKVFVELRDVNYPGSTYNLIYVPEQDQLQGIYYQALEQQSFEVYFQRLK
jgi:hypothetical protein